MFSSMSVIWGEAPQYLFYSYSSIDLMLNNVQGEEEVRRSAYTMCMHGTPQCMSTNECVHKISKAIIALIERAYLCSVH